INTITTTSTIATTTIATQCCFIFCRHVPNFEAIVVPHFCWKWNFILFALLYLKKNGREATLFANRVPTLPTGGTGYFAAGSSLRSTPPRKNLWPRYDAEIKLAALYASIKYNAC